MKTKLFYFSLIVLLLAACAPIKTAAPTPIVTEVPMLTLPTQTATLQAPTPDPRLKNCYEEQVHAGETRDHGDSWGVFVATLPTNDSIMSHKLVKTQLKSGLRYTFNIQGVVTWCTRQSNALEALMQNQGETSTFGNFVNFGYITPDPIEVSINGVACTTPVELEGWETYSSSYEGIYTTYRLMDGVFVKTKIPAGTWRFKIGGTVQFCNTTEAVDEIFDFLTAAGTEVDLQSLISWGYMEEMR